MESRKSHLSTADPGRVILPLLESVSKIARITNDKKLDHDNRLKQILRTILDYLGVEHGSIMIRDKKYLVVRAATRPEIIGHKQPIDDTSISGWVGKSGEPLFINNIIQDPRFKSSSTGIYKHTELLSVPILLEDKVVGVINVTDKTRRQKVLKDDIALLLQFSSMILSLLAQHKMHEELIKQKNTLRKKNRQLRLQEAKRDELSRMLIHDIKGPLSEVVANLDILSYSIPEDSKDFLEAAQTGCNRAVRMVSNLVDVGKIEDGNMQLIKEEIQPAILVEEAVSTVKGLASLKGIELALETTDGFPLLQADKVLMIRVLQNFLNNALNCSPPGTVITTGCRTMQHGRAVEFFVQDQGTGIDREMQNIIFDKYATLSCDEYGVVGTGLGLYFCRLVVEQHKGGIGVESSKGCGSRFYVTLPVEKYNVEGQGKKEKGKMEP